MIPPNRKTFLKIKLLTNVATFVFACNVLIITSAHAAGNDADATTNVNAGDTITSSDGNGLDDNNNSNHSITIDSNAGSITLGTLATTDAVTFSSQVGDITATYNITTSGANNLVTFAGDLHVKGTEILVLNATNTDILFQGDSQYSGGSSTLNLGAGSNTISATFDTAIAADNNFELAINANAANDIVTINITNTDGTSGNEITFVDAIGGANSTTEIDVVSIQSAAKATFDSTVRATTINSDTSEAITFNGLVTSNTITATGSGATLLNGGATLSTLTASGDVSSGTGALDINGTISMSGSNLIIGTGDATISGTSITADTITLQSGGDISFDGTAAQSISANIDGAGDVTIANDETVTFQNALGSSVQLGTLTVSTGKSARFESTVDAATFTIEGSAQIENTITSAGNINLTNASITIGDNFSAGDTIFIANDLVTTGTTTIAIDSGLNSGTYTFVDSATDASADIANLSVDNGILTKLSLVSNGNDIDLVVTSATADSLASELNVTTKEANITLIANQAIANGNATLLANFISAINAGGATAQKAVKSLAVQTENMDATASTSANLGTRVFRMTSDRLAITRDNTIAAAPISTDVFLTTADPKNSTWFKAFGTFADQRQTSDSESYDVNTTGTTFGYDRQTTLNSRLGAAFTYAYSDIDGGGAGEVSSQINSYQVNVYGDYVKEEYFIEGSIGAAFNTIESSRTIDFMGTDTVAVAEYNSSQYMAAVQGGTILKAGKTNIIPTIGFSYIRLQSETYTEIGAGGLNQRVEQDAMNILLGSIGTKINSQLKFGSGYLIPEIRGGVSYDFIGDRAIATSQFTGGGASFTVEGRDPEQMGGNVGIGLTYKEGDWLIGAEYDADIKNNYLSHSAQIKARLSF